MRRRLDEFRRDAKPGVPFPGWVWAAAVRLARRYGVHRTGRALGLEYAKLKRTCGGAGTAVRAARSVAARPSRAAGGPMKFVELTGALPITGMCRLLLAGPAGQHLQLEMAPGAATEMVLGLTRAGWGHGG
ncbi:MAG: hypothetical protein ACRETZ_12740 [Steroidobacteraceae bacterium]